MNLSLNVYNLYIIKTIYLNQIYLIYWNNLQAIVQLIQELAVNRNFRGLSSCSVHETWCLS